MLYINSSYDLVSDSDNAILNANPVTRKIKLEWQIEMEGHEKSEKYRENGSYLLMSVFITITS